MNGLASHDPHNRQDGIAKEQEAHSPVHHSLQLFAVGYANEEEANGNLGPHERGKCLDPFSERVLSELAEFMLVQELNMFAEAVVDFDKAERAADGCAELGRKRLA